MWHREVGGRVPIRWLPVGRGAWLPVNPGRKPWEAPVTAAHSEAITHLNALADMLVGVENLHVDRDFAGTPPRLSLRNTSMRDGRGWELLSGTIIVLNGRGKDWFVWDHGDRLAPVDALDTAAERVRHALTFQEPARAGEADVARDRLGAVS